MVIWLYCIFSNEAELLPFFLRHYAPIADRLIMYDNGSTDSGRALIEAYAHAEIRNYPAPHAVMESAKFAEFAAAEYKEARGLADFVLWVDTDEILWSGIITLREMLHGYRARGVRAIKAQGYQMLSETFPKQDAPITSQIHYGIRDNEYDKVCIFDPALNLRWRPGRHVCNIEGRAHPIHQGEIRLLHYRFLGEDFLKRRNAYNDAHLSPIERAAGRSYHMAANHQGKYSLAWYRQAMAYMSDVVTQNGVIR